jgi:hypothetical protein
MKTGYRLRLLLTCVLILGLNAHYSLSFAQTQITPQKEAIDFSKLKGGWIFVSEAPRKTLGVLHITNVNQNAQGQPALEGFFGISHNGLNTNNVAFEYNAEKQALTYKTKSGLAFQFGVKNLTSLEGVVLEGQRSYNKDQKFTLSKITSRPAIDLPASCAPLYGIWEGTWRNGGIPPQLLFIAEMKSDCTATVAQGGTYIREAKIENKKFSYLCNPQTQGVCNFDLTFADLWASYSDPSGGQNSAVFKRVVFAE